MNIKNEDEINRLRSAFAKKPKGNDMEEEKVTTEVNVKKEYTYPSVSKKWSPTKNEQFLICKVTTFETRNKKVVENILFSKKELVEALSLKHWEQEDTKF